jgi:hypothetical protein
MSTLYARGTAASPARSVSPLQQPINICDGRFPATQSIAIIARFVDDRDRRWCPVIVSQSDEHGAISA